VIQEKSQEGKVLLLLLLLLLFSPFSILDNEESSAVHAKDLESF